jgi:hypothetical protein
MSKITDALNASSRASGEAANRPLHALAPLFVAAFCFVLSTSHPSTHPKVVAECFRLRTLSNARVESCAGLFFGYRSN